MEKNIIDKDIHSFKIMNGNFTLCQKPYIIIGFNSDGQEDVLRIRKVTNIKSDVTCLDCKKILR